MFKDPSLKQVLIVVLSVILFGLTSALIAVGVATDAEIQQLAPPPEATTLLRFSETMPPPQQLVTVSKNGRDYFVWIGSNDKVLCASGPACYVFDSTGKLLMGDAKTGDGELTSEFVCLAYKVNQNIAVEEAIEMAERSSLNRSPANTP